VHRRRRRLPRLSQAAGADRGALRARSAGRAGLAALPHRRPRPLPSGRPHRISGPPGPADQAARLPHRAGRDRDRPARAPRGARRGGDGGGRSARGLPGGRLSALRRRVAPAPGGPPAGLHGAGGVRLPGRAADDRLRQGGPQSLGSAQAGAERAGGRPGTAHTGRGADGGNLRRSPADRARGGGGGLLRARRALAAGDPGGVAGACRVRRRAAGAGGVRGAHRRRAGPPPGEREVRAWTGDRAPAGRGEAAVVRAAEALVPRPVGARNRGLQHPGGGRGHGALGDGGPGSDVLRGDAAPRGIAHGLPRGAADRRTGQDHHPHRAREPGRAAGRRSRGAAGAGARRGGGTDRLRRSAAAVRSQRSERGGAAADHGAAAGAGALHGTRDDAPHRERRLVAGRAGPRAGSALRGVFRGPAESVAGARGAVRRLRGVAAAAAFGGVAGAGAGLVARPARRHAPGARSDVRPAASGHARHARRGAPFRARRRGARRPQPSVAAARRDSLHDPPRRLHQPAAPVHRSGRSGGRDPGRRADPRGGRAVDRPLRQHPRAARGSHR